MDGVLWRIIRFENRIPIPCGLFGGEGACVKIRSLHFVRRNINVFACIINDDIRRSIIKQVIGRARTGSIWVSVRKAPYALPLFFVGSNLRFGAGLCRARALAFPGSINQLASPLILSGA